MRVWPLASTAEARAVADALLPFVPGAVAAGVVSAALAAVGVEVPAGSLVALFHDPVGELLRRLRDPSSLAALLPATASWLGLPPNPDGSVDVVAGIVQLAATVTPGGTRLTAGTPAVGWQPVAGIHLAIGAGITIDQTGHVAPTGAASLTVDLPAAAAGTWTAVSLDIGVSASGLTIAVTPQPGAPIQLVPTFSGLDSLVGATADRFLPVVLDRLRDELPVGPARQAVLELCAAVGVYGTSFADGPVALRDLSPATLTARAAQIVVAVADLVADAFGAQVGGPGIPLGGAGSLTVAAVGGDLVVTIDGPLGAHLTLTADFDGPQVSRSR